MKILKRTLIILIIATTIFTVVEFNRIEDEDNIKQEQGEDTLPKDDEKDKEEKEEENKDKEEDKEKQDKNDKPKEEQEKEEIESPVELG